MQTKSIFRQFHIAYLFLDSMSCVQSVFLPLCDAHSHRIAKHGKFKQIFTLLCYKKKRYITKRYIIENQISIIDLKNFKYRNYENSRNKYLSIFCIINLYLVA